MKFLVAVFLLIYCTSLLAQVDPTWDDTKSKDWPEAFQRVEIISSLDKAIQPAYFYSSKGDKVRPLIVSLHTWSGGYDQKESDSLLHWTKERDYNYIHPDFRGPNKTPQACGSKYAIQDIDDAIKFAIENGNVDLHEIHVMGASGGGYSTLLAYMKTAYDVKTFSAWVPISNLVDWYYESVGRKAKYARDIALATTGIEFGQEDYYLDETEAKLRSPVFMDTPTDKRSKSKLYIYTGIHDGYEGSVPITQSLKFFNKVVKDFDSANTKSLISTEDMLSLVERRNTTVGHPSKIQKGDFLFQRKYKDKVQVSVFEGGHERLPDLALAQMYGSKILAIGDSNGANENGWVNQLKSLNFSDFIVNTSVSGNTIGFDNNGRKELNTLRNVDGYLESAVSELNGLDKIIIMLGTNDCKAVFDKELKDVPKNLRKLIKKIKSHDLYIKHKPTLYVVSPPPSWSDDKMKEKYHGSAKDIEWLFPRFKEISEKEGCTFIDTYSTLLPQWDNLTADGIHLTLKGQVLIAKIISEQL
jgi:lysophospholipase L1-like esterase/dienelactone hydrolase